MLVWSITRLALLGLLSLLLACNAATPTPPALPTTGVVVAAALAPTDTAAAATATPPLPTPEPTSTPVPPSPAPSPTSILRIILITPTPFPTYPPGAASSSSSASGGPTASPRPSGLGSGPADAALVGILQRCWNVSDTRQLNGNNAAHRAAFECARPLLVALAKNYSNYALVHRVLAWGYFYKDNNSSTAIGEYRAAANIYKSAGDSSGESEARMRLALLLVASNPVQGCAELAAASNLDRTNIRALDYYSAFNCRNVANSSGGGGGGASAGGANQPPPPPQVDIATLHGKIAFKSERDGFPAYYVMDPDGKNVQRISGAAYDAVKQWDAWSPDRTQAATVRPAGFTRKFGYDNDIWITDPSGYGRPLTNPANDYDPAWSPVPLFDGRGWIAFVSNRGDLNHPDHEGEDLWVMHEDGTSPFRISCHAPYYSKHPSWSPDGQRLVFYSNQQGDHPQIFVMDMGRLGTLQQNCDLGENPINLSHNDFADSEPVWVK